MKEKEEILAALRNLDTERMAVRMMQEDIAGIEQDIKKELPAVQREALKRERETLLLSKNATEHHISRLERLLALLSPEERNVLERTLVNPYPGAVFDLATEMFCDSSRIYRIRARALSKLVRLRYGAGE